MLQIAKPIYIYTLYYATTVWRLTFTFPLLYCAATVCHQAGKWFPDKLDQQAATQCSLNSTEMCANAFSKWPLWLYLIAQNGVNLNVIVVCHGEAHLARLCNRLPLTCSSPGVVLQRAWRSSPPTVLILTGKLPPPCLFFHFFLTVWGMIPTSHLPSWPSPRICGKLFPVCLHHLSTLARTFFSCLFITLLFVQAYAQLSSCWSKSVGNSHDFFFFFFLQKINLFQLLANLK